MQKRVCQTHPRGTQTSSYKEMSKPRRGIGRLSDQCPEECFSAYLCGAIEEDVPGGAGEGVPFLSRGHPLKIVSAVPLVQKV